MGLTFAEIMPDESSFDEPSGACAAVDFNKEENQKTIKEIELFFEIKDYICLLNREACLPQLKLQIIASTYECTKDRFCIVVYMANKWKNFLVDGLAKCIKEKYAEKVSQERVLCEYVFVEVVKDY